MEDNLECLLIKYSGDPLLKGVRHVIQGEADPEFMLRKDFNRGICMLKKYSLVYDLLIVERQLPQAIQLVDKHPCQPFVLDHIAKPLIGRNELSPWKEHIRELAKRENVSCKLSGMVTEADFQHWTPEQLLPYFEVVVEAFGPNRLLFGSDWPVCLVATNYKNWADLVRTTIASFSVSEQAGIMGGNAVRVYGLKS
jgi:L-fuconolactonase